MFTGIVEELGEVVALERAADSARVSVRGPTVTADTRPGDSVSVNGVCLTVVELVGDVFTSDVMRETLLRSSLGALDVGSPVNLERAMAAGGRFGGHVVQGHVDGTGRLLRRTSAERWEVVRVSLPGGLARYVVEKGSITVDGVSLTVSGLGADGPPEERKDWFEVSLIPVTLAATTLGRKQVGEPVNLEVDVLAKYVERLLAVRS